MKNEGRKNWGEPTRPVEICCNALTVMVVVVVVVVAAGGGGGFVVVVLLGAFYYRRFVFFSRHLFFLGSFREARRDRKKRSHWPSTCLLSCSSEQGSREAEGAT